MQTVALIREKTVSEQAQAARIVTTVRTLSELVNVAEKIKDGARSVQMALRENSEAGSLVAEIAVPAIINEPNNVPFEHRDRFVQRTVPPGGRAAGKILPEEIDESKFSRF